MPRPIRGAVWAIFVTAGAGAIHGVIVPMQECGVTADRFTSAMFATAAYLWFLGVPAALIGAISGVVVGHCGDARSRCEISKETSGDHIA